MSDKFLLQELRVEEWIKKATDDELTALSILKHRDAPPNGVCFVSQQMAEKYLKAFLVFKKNWFPKIHPTDILWEHCNDFDSEFSLIKKDAVFLTGFYAATRYPGDYPDFSWKEAEQAFAAAARIKNFVLEKINKK